jgi:hypothetical protein
MMYDKLQLERSTNGPSLHEADKCDECGGPFECILLAVSRRGGSLDSMRVCWECKSRIFSLFTPSVAAARDPTE